MTTDPTDLDALIAALRERGVTPFACTRAAWLRAAWLAAEDWPVLAPPIDLAVWPGLGGHGEFLWLRGMDAEGDLVATRAARLYDTGPASLRDLVDGGTLFWPDRHAAPLQALHAESPALDRIRGRLVLSTAGWTRPGWRGRGISGLMSRAMKRWAEVPWPGIDWHIALVAADEADRQARSYRPAGRFDGAVRWLGGPVERLSLFVWPVSQQARDTCLVPGDRPEDGESYLVGMV